uniref:Rho guanine nucleotide exchange factor (GEF) 19 n=1 Tax=Cyprinus carpio TaxID=7962 RepID=A0A8C2HTE7_CYPCA
MLPGYGFSPLLDVQPHLQAFHCRGESSDMWFPALSDSREGRPLLGQHQHIAVCQQETLAFIDLQQSSVNGFQTQTLENCSSSLCSKPVKCNGNGPSDFVKNGSTDTKLDNYLTEDTNNVEGVQDQMWTPINGLPETVYEKPEPGVKGLSSRDLFLPLSPTYEPENRNCLEPQELSSPTSPLDFQSLDPFCLQRRTSLRSIKEKSIRRKMRVYSPDTLSDGSLSSPGVECDYLLPTSFESFVEGGLGMVGSTIPTSHSSSSLPGVDEDLSLLTISTPPKPFLDPPQEDARLEGGVNDGGRQRLGLEDCGSLEGPALNSVTSLPLSRSRSADERRRFSASELISRLQLSQRKNSFTLKLGKSLSARVASRDRHLSGNLSSDYKPNSRHHFSGGSGDSAPHSPVGSAPHLPSADSNLPQQRRSSKQSMRKVSIDEDGDSPPSSSKRLSRFLPNCNLSIVVDHFMMSPELCECLGTQEKQWLFSKLPDVKEVSERFLQDLEHRLEEDILRFDVCDIVLDHCPALRRVYLPYVTNQAYQEQTYQRLLQEKPRFPGILARLEEDPVCQRLPLTAFLILPFQRITRLQNNILKRTRPGSRDEDTATKALNELKKIIKECNSSVQSMKRMEELIHLNKKIHFEGKIFPLISQSRWLVKHGELLELDMQNMSISGSKFKLTTRPVYLHLFNDCLLLSRRKDTWKFMVFVHAKIEGLKVKDLSQKLQGIPGFIFYLHLCEGQQLKYQILLKSPTESSKQRWITAMFPSDLKTAIEQTNENDDLSQVQCIKSYQSQEHDELTLEKADILQAVTITSDGWVEGIRLSDGERGWFPKTYVEEITSRSARLRNLRENIRIKCVSQKLEGETL